MICFCGYSEVWEAYRLHLEQSDEETALSPWKNQTGSCNELRQPWKPICVRKQLSVNGLIQQAIEALAWLNHVWIIFPKSMQLFSLRVECVFKYLAELTALNRELTSNPSCPCSGSWSPAAWRKGWYCRLWVVWAEGYCCIPFHQNKSKNVFSCV